MFNMSAAISSISGPAKHPGKPLQQRNTIDVTAPTCRELAVRPGLQSPALCGSTFIQSIAAASPSREHDEPRTPLRQEAAYGRDEMERPRQTNFLALRSTQSLEQRATPRHYHLRAGRTRFIHANLVDV